MKFKSTKDVASERFVCLVSGESGIGKTSLAKTLPEPESETLIISAESGLLCLSGTDIPVYEINPNETWKSITEIFDYLTTDEAKKKFKYLFVDSLTEIAQLVLAELKRDPKLSDPKNAFPLWGQYADRMIKIIKVFRDFRPYSVVFTCLTTTEKDGLELVDQFSMPGQSVKENLKAYFDLSLHYKVFTDDNGVKHRKLITDVSESPLAKDRSGFLDSYEDANLTTIIKKVLNEK